MIIHAKVGASTLAGAFTGLTIWCLQHWNIVVPTEIALDMTIAFSAIAGYLAPNQYYSTIPKG